MEAGWRQRWQRPARSAAALAVVLLLAACSSPQSPAPGGPAASSQAGSADRVLPLTGIQVLRSLFNRDLGHSRLVLILSPT